MAEMLFMNWQQRVKLLLLDNAETRFNDALKETITWYRSDAELP